MAELTSSVAPDGDTVRAGSTIFSVEISGGTGKSVRFVKNGKALEKELVTSDPFSHTLEAQAPASGEDRYRVEVVDDDGRRTLTSYLWLTAPAISDAGADAGAADSGPQRPAATAAGGGCACRLSPDRSRVGMQTAGMFLLSLLACWRRRSRRRDHD
jgi:MYXO-CTERM domain-containing protein